LSFKDNKTSSVGSKQTGRDKHRTSSYYDIGNQPHQLFFDNAEAEKSIHFLETKK